jgi:hypothetical protein
LKALNDNWQKGNFSLKTYPFDERLEGYFSMNEKYLVMLQGDVGLNVYERSSMKLTHVCSEMYQTNMILQFCLPLFRK